MRIAQVAPLYEEVPPKLYGGTERVVPHLTDALVGRVRSCCLPVPTARPAHNSFHEGHFRVAILRGLGVVEDALAVALQPPPGILVDQLEPLFRLFHSSRELR